MSRPTDSFGHWDTDSAAQALDVSRFDELGLQELQTIWFEHYGRPPAIRSVEIFRLMLAWRLQAEIWGGLDEPTKRALRHTSPASPEAQHLDVGTVLRRQWDGEEVSVLVVRDGYFWNGRIYRSLSAVAGSIAGSKWNGPKFFGLRP